MVRSLILGLVSSVVLSLASGVFGGNASPRPSATVAWRSRLDFRVRIGDWFTLPTTTEYRVIVPSIAETSDPMEEVVQHHIGPALHDTYLAPGAPLPVFADPHASNMGYPVRFITIGTAGVPFTSFWGYVADDIGKQVTGGSWAPWVVPKSRGPIWRVFPYRPLWDGLALNTLVHATLWFGFFTLVRMRITARRAMRGQCPRCAYDRRGLDAAAACPECGTAPQPNPEA